MTPAWFTLSGMYVEVPPYTRRPIMRFAYCTGMRRWACSMNTTPVMMRTPMASTKMKTHQPRFSLICQPSDGSRAAIEVKISTDMPLPTPRSVMSSPSHMTTPVPAVIVMTRVASVSGVPSAFSGTIGKSWHGLLVPPRENSCPDRASATNADACSTASPSVRYRVYCVIFACPDWPSFFSCSRRGMTTVSSWRMMLAVMYGMMPRAKTDNCSSAPPEKRFRSVNTPLWSEPLRRSRHSRTFVYDTPGLGSVAPSR